MDLLNENCENGNFFTIFCKPSMLQLWIDLKLTQKNSLLKIFWAQYIRWNDDINMIWIIETTYSTRGILMMFKIFFWYCSNGQLSFSYTYISHPTNFHQFLRWSLPPLVKLVCLYRTFHPINGFWQFVHVNRTFPTHL